MENTTEGLTTGRAVEDDVDVVVPLKDLRDLYELAKDIGKNLGLVVRGFEGLSKDLSVLCLGAELEELKKAIEDDEAAAEV